jgi:hypothetical protein
MSLGFDYELPNLLALEARLLGTTTPSWTRVLTMEAGEITLSSRSWTGMMRIHDLVGRRGARDHCVQFE